MSIFVRQVQMPKWNCVLSSETDFTSLSNNGFHDISSDPITKDMGTTNGTLSVWQVNDTSKKSIGEIALALIVGQSHVNRMDLMWFCLDPNENSEIHLRKTFGQSKLSDMNSYHHDIVDLSYKNILPVVSLFATALYKEQYVNFLKDEVMELLLSAIKSERIRKEDLPSGIQKDLEKYNNRGSNKQ